VQTRRGVRNSARRLLVRLVRALLLVQAMRTPTALSLLALLLVLPGCPPTDDPDVVGWYKRGSEQVVQCTNGGFSANLQTGLVDGLWTTPTPETNHADMIANDATTSANVFTLSYRQADNTWGSAEIGEGWVQYGVSDSERAAIHARCEALEGQPWWH
jgi:hypothetical protein